MKKSIVLFICLFLLSALVFSTSACKKEQEKPYTATLDVNGGDPLEQSAFSFDVGDFFVFETPERTGYTFLGWYDGDEKLKGTVWKFTEDKTFKAKGRSINISLLPTATGQKVKSAERLWGPMITVRRFPFRRYRRNERRSV